MNIGSSVSCISNRSVLFSKFKVIHVFRFGDNIIKFFPAKGVIAARFPNKGVQSKLHVKECILEDFRDSRGGERGESSSRMYLSSRESTIDDPESV